MPGKRKFGIAFDLNGNPEWPHAWAWYWRYPAAFLGIAIAAWIALSPPIPATTKQLLVAGGLILFSLSIAYELGCLIVLGAFFWAIAVAIDHFLPNNFESMDWRLVAAVGLAVYAVWVANVSMREANRLRAELTALQITVRELASREEFHSGDLYGRVKDLEAEQKPLHSGHPWDAP